MSARSSYPSFGSTYGLPRNRGDLARQPFQECRRSSCHKEAAANFQYCSSLHAQEAVLLGEVSACTYCRRFPTNEGFKYCSPKCGRADSTRSVRPPAAPPGSYQSEGPSLEGDGYERSTYGGPSRTRNEGSARDAARRPPVTSNTRPESRASIAPSIRSSESHATVGVEDFRIFYYQPCGCSVRTKVATPAKEVCPACGKPARPRFMEENGGNLSEYLPEEDGPEVDTIHQEVLDNYDSTTDTAAQAQGSPSQTTQPPVPSYSNSTVEYGARPLPPPPNAPRGPRLPTQPSNPRLEVPSVRALSIIDQDLSDQEGNAPPISPTHNRPPRSIFGNSLGIDTRPPFSKSGSSSSMGQPSFARQPDMAAYETGPALDPFTNEVPPTPSDVSHQSQDVQREDDLYQSDVAMLSPMDNGSRRTSMADFVTINGYRGDDSEDNYTSVEYAGAPEDRYPRLPMSQPSSVDSHQQTSRSETATLRGGQPYGQSDIRNGQPPGRPQSVPQFERGPTASRPPGSASPIPPLPPSPRAPGDFPNTSSRRSSDAGPPRNEAERQQRYQELFNANRLSVPDVRVPEINETIGANATSSRRPVPPPRPALPLARRSGALPALPPSGPVVLEEIPGKRLYSLTNPAACVIKYQDQQYPSASHLFHAMKFMPHQPNLAKHIQWCVRDGEDPEKEAKRLEPERREDWTQICIAKMDEVLEAKFKQHPKLQAILAGTGEAQLVLMTPEDDFWGVRSTGEGRNQFGEALMRIRDKIAWS